MTQFLHVGNSTLAVSPDEAVQIGLEAAKKITVSVNGANVPIALQSYPLSFYQMTGTREPFTQYPEYYMFFGPDGSQGIRYGVQVYVWAYNGEVAYCQTQSTYSPPRTLYPLPTPTLSPVSSASPMPSLTPQPTQTFTPQPTASPIPTPIPTLVPTTVEAATNGGSKINLPISGNVSSSQMTNVTLSTDAPSATTTLSFSLTGKVAHPDLAT